MPVRRANSEPVSVGGVLMAAARCHGEREHASFFRQYHSASTDEVGTGKFVPCPQATDSAQAYRSADRRAATHAATRGSDPSRSKLVAQPRLKRTLNLLRSAAQAMSIRVSKAETGSGSSGLIAGHATGVRRSQAVAIAVVALPGTQASGSRYGSEGSSSVTPASGPSVTRLRFLPSDTKEGSAQALLRTMSSAALLAARATCTSSRVGVTRSPRSSP